MATETTTGLTRVAVRFSPHVARVSLQNSRWNVIDIPMMRELQQVVADVEARPGISAIVIKGTEKAFSSGVDIKAHTPDKIVEMLREFHGVIRALVSSRKVTISVVRGLCLGGGAELAMVCDMIFTAEDATWGFPEIKLGCYPPVAASALAAVIGQKRAAELILTGRQISGDEAVALGLANHSTRAEEVHNIVEDTLLQLVKLSPAALAVTKKAMYAWDAIHFDKGLARAEKIYLEELMQTQDAQEGISAFLEKRAPEWKGK